MYNAVPIAFHRYVIIQFPFTIDIQLREELLSS